MSTTPPRPAVNDAMVREVVIKALSQMNLDEEGIDAVVDVYTPHADGYQLAKELDMIHGWVVDMALVEDLDGISSAVERAHRMRRMGQRVQHPAALPRRHRSPAGDY